MTCLYCGEELAPCPCGVENPHYITLKGGVMCLKNKGAIHVPKKVTDEGIEIEL
jgi:hypothetical protein